MIKDRNRDGYNDAVSETVGFVIIFGIMLMGITLVTLYGYPALLDAQQNANIRNMERNMISLQSDVNALTYKAVPYKETTMQVSGGVLSVKEPDSGNSYLIISNATGPLFDAALFSENKLPLGELHFLSESGDIAIALQNGAVVKWQLGGAGVSTWPPSVMLSEPRWFIDTSGGTTTMVITLIQVNSSTSLAKSGICNVQMSIEPLNITAGSNIIDVPAGGTVKVQITLADKFYKAWANYFEHTLRMTKVDDINWEKSGVNRVIIKAWKINVINI